MTSKPKKSKVLELITEYISRTAQLDGILNELTRDYCANDCPRKPRGCCGYGTYGAHIPKEMIQMQDAEALRNGWTARGESEYQKTQNCRYHSSTGCKLTTLKPPLCIKFICSDLARYLMKQDKKNRAFLDYDSGLHGVSSDLKSLKNDPIEREVYFKRFDNAIAEGYAAVERKKQREAKQARRK